MSDTPASISRAMCGWVRRARMVPSRLNRCFAGAADQRGIQQLQRRLAFETAVAALRQPDAAHPAVADRRDQPIGADGHARQGRFRRRHDRRGRRGIPRRSTSRCSASMASTSAAMSGSVAAQLPQADGAVGAEVQHHVQIGAGAVPARPVEGLHRSHSLQDRNPVAKPDIRPGHRRPAASRAGKCAPFPSRAARSARTRPVIDADFGEREAAEELEIDDPREPRLGLLRARRVPSLSSDQLVGVRPRPRRRRRSRCEVISNSPPRFCAWRRRA